MDELLDELTRRRYGLEGTERMALTLPKQLVFLPGIGADHRLFKNQTTAFPNCYAADWIDPFPTESLEQYAVRFAETIRSELEKRPTAPVVVCGLSLGGMIAPYVARELSASGCILLCSIRSPKEFPVLSYPDWLLMRLCPPLRLVRVCTLQLGARCLLFFPGLLRWFVSPLVVRQFAEMPPRRFASLARMMFDWAFRYRLPENNDEKIFDKPMLHVHGTNDWLLPIRRTHPDIRVKGGGHLLVLTHPNEINAIIERFVAEIPPSESDASGGN